jgi:hypothetical protein
MKKAGKTANMYVMFGLLSVLFLSLGYLSMQGGREGMEGAGPSGMPKSDTKTTPEEEDESAMPPNKATEETLKQPFGSRKK